MKHDHSGRRRDRRGNSPSVIRLPSQMPPYTPPRREAEASEPTPPPENAELDTELLAHRNIFEVQPRMSRQARRKAARAEKKAARRAVADRFLAGAPSLAEAASQIAAHAPEPEFAGRHAEAAMLDDEMDVPMPAEAIDAPAIVVAEAVEDAELLVMERPAEAVIDAEIVPAEMDLVEEEEEIVPLEEIAQIISATGPLIVARIDPETGPVDESTAPAAAFGPFWHVAEAKAEAMKAMALEESEADVAPCPVLHLAAPEPEPQPAPEIRIEPRIRIEEATIPLPRSRALVTHRRHWLARLVPWLAPRRKAPALEPAPEPAFAQLQELRFELASALRRLDQILDQAV